MVTHVDRERVVGEMHCDSVGRKRTYISIIREGMRSTWCSDLS